MISEIEVMFLKAENKLISIIHALSPWILIAFINNDNTFNQ